MYMNIEIKEIASNTVEIQSEYNGTIEQLMTCIAAILVDFGISVKEDVPEIDIEELYTAIQIKALAEIDVE